MSKKFLEMKQETHIITNSTPDRQNLIENQ